MPSNLKFWDLAIDNNNVFTKSLPREKSFMCHDLFNSWNNHVSLNGIILILQRKLRLREVKEKG